MSERQRGWIGVDFDGTLVEYHHWVNDQHAGPPIPSMVALIRQFLAEGLPVRIFTARCFDLDGNPVPRAIEFVEGWCREHLGQVLPITCRKDFLMVMLYDDRCTAVETNTGRLITG